ncbi:DUF3800 domain-containing protein [Rhizobium leguminosarum]|uniref:DUF3800 domain-containing protein n=1 Tax=Rhizobium leguminosarum TaxID=384 RepID=A0A7K3VM02_RHILE|nr:DUF3800 domain-containing protein [Rhizobium leguminosarum]NEK18149.1 DUF3800 domain-containing protein [Rhizobium leguminosarum]
MSTIFFDESGQTGAQLRDIQQPYFCIGSTDLSNEASQDILSACFPRQTVGEIKAQNLLRRATGRRQFVTFCEALAAHPERFCFVKIHKRFSVLSKMVDNLVEPYIRAAGYDFYKNDYGRRFANSAYFAFDQLLARDLSDRLLDQYNDFARAPDRRTLVPLQATLVEALEDAPRGTELFLDLMSQGAQHFEDLHDIEQFRGSNEIHVTAIIRCMAHWQAHSESPFKVVHDESIHFFENSRGWHAMTDPQMRAQILTVGDKTLSLPISVVETVPAKSHESASLQLCDLLAGFLTRFASPNLDEEHRRFLQEAISAGLGTVSIFPVEAGYDFVSGEPARADGPDIIDQIAMAMAETKGRL